MEQTESEHSVAKTFWNIVTTKARHLMTVIIIVIIIIIIIWLYSPNRALAFPFWDFVTITFLRGWIVSPEPNPQLEDQASAFMTPETGWPSYTPWHWVPILVAFYDMHGLQWDYSLIPATKRTMTTTVV
jgi:hypothetical protein